jgi:glycosyltransferase involved in cell wall biosynthesis
MNIGIDAKRFFFNSSGLGVYARNFYKALSSLAIEDNFYLYTKLVKSENIYLREVKKQNTTLVSPQHFHEKIFGGAFWRSYFIHNQLIKNKIDIYYGLSNEIPMGIEKQKTKSVVVIHDLIFLRYPNLYPAIDVFFYKKKTAFSCKNADFILTISEQTKKDIVDFLHINPNKIHIIPPNCNDIYVEKEKEAINLPKNLQFDKPYILSVGAITPRKNLLKTVQAFQLIAEKTGIDLVIVGSAVGLGKAYLAEIQEFIHKNNLSHKIHFLENVANQYLPTLYRNAQMLVYPSQFEGFGLPIIEALFCKTPVITSNGSCFDTTAGGGALYVNPNEITEIAAAIEKLLISKELRADLISKGFLHVQQFKTENVAKQIFEFHTKIKSS